METVIAKSKKNLLAAYIVFLVLGVVFCGIGAFLTVWLADLDTEIASGIIVIVCGVFLVSLGLGYVIYFARMPESFITIKEGKLHFWNGLECSPAEIDYCSSRGGGLDGAMFNYGRLIISVRHTEYKIRFVEDASGVVSKLNALKAQTMAVEEIQKHIAEKNAEETTKTEEPVAEVKEENTQG